jgi:hypothetical protein
MNVGVLYKKKLLSSVLDSNSTKTETQKSDIDLLVECDTTPDHFDPNEDATSIPDSLPDLLTRCDSASVSSRDSSLGCDEPSWKIADQQLFQTNADTDSDESSTPDSLPSLLPCCDNDSITSSNLSTD